MHKTFNALKTYFVATSTLTGFCKDALWSFWTYEKEDRSREICWPFLMKRDNIIQVLILQTLIKDNNTERGFKWDSMQVKR